MGELLPVDGLNETLIRFVYPTYYVVKPEAAVYKIEVLKSFAKFRGKPLC